MSKVHSELEKLPFKFISTCPAAEDLTSYRAPFPRVPAQGVMPEQVSVPRAVGVANMSAIFREKFAPLAELSFPRWEDYTDMEQRHMLARCLRRALSSPVLIITHKNFKIPIRITRI